MKSISLPAINCESPCSECGSKVEFMLFMSSHYDFGTYQGLNTGTYYRLNEELIKYGVTSKDEALTSAVAAESGADNLIEMPSLIHCSSCNKTTRGGEVTQINETTIEAVCLPLGS